MELIKDKAKLATFITSTVKTYQTAGDRVHQAFVSALYAAATTGYVEHLNKLYAGLRSNDQTAIRQFIRRSHIIIGGADPDETNDVEVNKAAADAGQVLDFKQGAFLIRSGRGHTSSQAKALAKLCEERFIKPDGKKDRKVLDRNNFAEARTLGDGEVLKAVIRALKMPEGSTERRQVSVSNRTGAWLSKVLAEAEDMLEGMNDDAPKNSNVPADTRVPRKAAGSVH